MEVISFIVSLIITVAIVVAIFDVILYIAVKIKEKKKRKQLQSVPQSDIAKQMQDKLAELPEDERRKIEMGLQAMQEAMKTK